MYRYIYIYIHLFIQVFFFLPQADVRDETNTSAIADLYIDRQKYNTYLYLGSGEPEHIHTHTCINLSNLFHGPPFVVLGWHPLTTFTRRVFLFIFYRLMCVARRTRAQ